MALQSTETSSSFIPLILHEEIQGILPVTILHSEDKELFDSFYMQKARDLLSSLQDLTHAFQFFKDIPDIPVIHDIPAFQALLHVPVLPVPCSVSSTSRDSTHYSFTAFSSRIQILHTDWFPPETSLSTSRRQYTTTNLHSSKKGRCCDMGQNDTIGKIELIPSSVLSENNTNYKNDIHKFSNSLSYQESTEIPIYTSRC